MSSPLYRQQRQEKACHRFADAFLLPREALFTHFGRHRSRVEWRELAMLKQEYAHTEGSAHKRRETRLTRGQKKP